MIIYLHIISNTTDKVLPNSFYLKHHGISNCLSNYEPRMYADDAHLTYAGDCVDNLQLYLNLDLENVHKLPTSFFPMMPPARRKKKSNSSEDSLLN